MSNIDTPDLIILLGNSEVTATQVMIPPHSTHDLEIMLSSSSWRGGVGCREVMEKAHPLLIATAWKTLYVK